MKRILLGLGKFVLGILIFLIAYLGIGWVLAQISVSEEANTADEITIYIKSNGVHTDIVVPAVTAMYDWTAMLPYEDAKQVDSTHAWIGIGWGDKGFYLETPEWADLKASVAFKAAFGLSTTAMHTTYFKKMTEDEDCKKILISKEQYQRLVNYIDGSFERSSDFIKVKGMELSESYIKIDTDANYGTTDAFYEAHGSYSLFKTCNSWANNALKASGQKAAIWTAFDTGIFSKYD